VTIGDILIYGGCGFGWLVGVGWLVWHRLYPRQAEGMHHISAIDDALKNGMPEAARAAYATLRELASRTPDLLSVREMQLIGMYKLLRHWNDVPRADHTDVALAEDELALVEQMWTDLCAIAPDGERRPRSAHMMVRVLSVFIRVVIGENRLRATEALRLMARFYRHCTQCSDTFSGDLLIFGKRLGVG
jgi:hypothetical protein